MLLRASIYHQECKTVNTYCPPRCSVEGLRLPLPSSSAAGERKHTPPPRCRPSWGCALEAGSGSSSPINTEDRNKGEVCELSLRMDITSEFRGHNPEPAITHSGLLQILVRFHQNYPERKPPCSTHWHRFSFKTVLENQTQQIVLLLSGVLCWWAPTGMRVNMHVYWPDEEEEETSASSLINWLHKNASVNLELTFPSRAVQSTRRWSILLCNPLRPTARRLKTYFLRVRC